MAKRRSEAVPGDARPEWLSTTGGGGADPKPHARGRYVVELRRTAAPAVQHLPETLQLGGSWPDVVTVGRHERSGAVLHLKAASKIHCQFALRTFHVPQQDETHEALFLCDVSKHKTYVNGTPAFRPWHWVQDGDAIGLPSNEVGLGGVLDFYKVHYCDLHKLPSTLVTIPSSPGQLPSPPANGAHRPASGARQPSKPGKGKQAHGRGRQAARAPRGAAKEGRKVHKPVRFGEEILGRIIDLSYLDPPATYRLLIVHFDREHRWHHVDSNGLSTWDGESFTDEVDLNQMYGQGLVRFVDGNSGDEHDGPSGANASSDFGGQAQLPQMAPLWTLKLLYFSSAFGQMLVVRFITTYFVKINLSTDAIGLLQAARPIASFLGELFWSSMVEHGFGFKQTIIPCNTLGVVLFACMPLASSFAQLITLFALSSFLFTWLGLRDARVIATLKNQGEDDGEYGRIRKFAAVGWGASGLLSGQLQEHCGYYSMFVLFIFSQVLVVLIIAVVPLDEPGPRQPASKEGSTGKAGQDSFSATLRTGWVALFFLNLLVFGFCMSAVEAFLFVYLLKDFVGSSDALVGSTLAMMTVTELPVFQFSGRLLSFGFVPLFTLSHFILALKCALYSALPREHPWLVLAIEPLHGFTFAAMWCAAVDFGRRYAPDACKQRFQGLTSGLYFQLSFFCGALVWAPVMTAVGYRDAYRITAAVTIAWSFLWNVAQRFAKPGRAAGELAEKLLARDDDSNL